MKKFSPSNSNCNITMNEGYTVDSVLEPGNEPIKTENEFSHDRPTMIHRESDGLGLGLGSGYDLGTTDSKHSQ